MKLKQAQFALQCDFTEKNNEIKTSTICLRMWFHGKKDEYKIDKVGLHKILFHFIIERIMKLKQELSVNLNVISRKSTYLHEIQWAPLLEQLELNLYFKSM